jgi:hypothetical protein
MKPTITLSPNEIDLRNFESMYELGVLAQQQKCSICILIANALIFQDFCQKSNERFKLSLDGMPKADADQLGISMRKPGILTLSKPFLEKVQAWSVIRYGQEEGLETALVREAIELFLEAIDEDAPMSEEEVIGSFDFESNEFLLTTQAETMLNVLREETDPAEYLKTAIGTVYAETFGKAQLLLSGENDLLVEKYLVITTTPYERMLEKIASKANLERELAVCLIIQCMWDNSEHKEQLLFTPS